MRRLLLCFVVALLACGTAFGWDTNAHATIAKIAENHLTPKAKRCIDKYLDGRSIVYYASYADFYKSQLLMDLGFEPTNAKRKLTFPHTFEANADFSVYKGIRRGDEHVKNCVYLAEQYAADLKANHRTMSDSLRVLSIAMIVHWLGDMHCPEHIRYVDDQTIGNYPVTYRKKVIRYHTIWDGILFAELFPWGYSDSAALIDTYSKKEIKAICEGDLYDWGKEVAEQSYPVHAYREGAVIKGSEYRNKFAPLAESLLRNGGYRLAKILNEIFK